MVHQISVMILMGLRLIVLRPVYGGALAVVVGVMQTLSMLDVIPMERITVKLRRL